MRFGSVCALATLFVSIVGCSDVRDDSPESVDPIEPASADVESAISASTDASDAVDFGDRLLDFKGLRDREFGGLRDRLGKRGDGPERTHRLRDLFEKLRGDDCGKPDMDSERLHFDFGDDGCRRRDGLFASGRFEARFGERDGLDLGMRFDGFGNRDRKLGGGLELGHRDGDGPSLVKIIALGSRDGILDGDLDLGGDRDRKIFDGKLTKSAGGLKRVLKLVRFARKHGDCLPHDGGIEISNESGPSSSLQFDADTPRTGICGYKMGDGPERKIKLGNRCDRASK